MNRERLYAWIRWVGSVLVVLRLPSLLSGDPAIIALLVSVSTMWAIHWMWPCP